MNLIILTLGCAVSAFCVQALVMRQRAILVAEPDSIRPVQFGVYMLLVYLRVLFFTAAIVYMLFLIVVWSVQFISGLIETELIITTINTLGSWRSVVSEVASTAGYVIAVLVTLGLCVWIYQLGAKLARRVMDGAQDLECADVTPASEVAADRTDPQAIALRFLLSRGLFDSMGKGKRSLVLMGLVLTLLSLVGAESAGEVLDDSVQVLQLTAERSTSSAVEALENLRKPLAEQSEVSEILTDEDVGNLAQKLALEFENALIHSLRPKERPPDVKSVRTLNEMRIREQVMSTYVRRNGKARHIVLDRSLSAAANLSPAQREILREAERLPLNPSNLSGFGVRIESDIRQILDNEPLRRRVAKSAERWTRSFSEPLTATDLLGNAMKNLVNSELGEAFAGKGTAEVDELLKFGKSAAKKGIASAMERLYTAWLAGYLVRVAKGDGPAAAAATAIKLELERPVVLDIERTAIKRRMNELAKKTPPLSQALEPLKRSRPTVRVALGPELAFSHPTYADLFPGRIDKALTNHAAFLMRRSFDFKQVSHLSKVGRRILRKPPSRRLTRPGEGYGARIDIFREPPPTVKIIIGEPPSPPIIEIPRGFSPPKRPVETVQEQSLRLKGQKEKAQIEEELDAISERPLNVVETAKRYEQSFLYERASLYSKVGGVVLGRPPDTVLAPALDLVEIRWRREVAGIRLSLQRASGELIEVPGIYDESTLFQALSYAADGRPVAVTMIRPAMADTHLKILLHPILLDTELGVAAIELDRLVDRYFVANERAVAVMHLDQQLSLYHIARLTVANALLQKYRQILKKQYRALKERLISAMEAVRTQRPSIQTILGTPRVSTRRSAGQLLRELQVPLAPDFLGKDKEAIDVRLHDPRLRKLAASVLLTPSWSVDASVFMHRRAAFDDQIVDIIVRCRASADLNAFVSCVENEAQPEAARAGRTVDLKVRISELMAPTYLIEVVSGVREQPYRIDPDLDFLKATSAPVRYAGLWPFRFLLHATLTPVSASGSEVITEPISAWPLPGVSSSQIANSIESGVEADTRTLEALNHMREFAVLQRLFRAAFDGHLGPQFPTYRLTELAEVLGETPLGLVKTGRWSK